MTRTVLRSQLIDQLREGYVFPELGESLAMHVEQSFMEGTYEALHDPSAFAKQLTKDLLEVGNDKHLRLYAGGRQPITRRYVSRRDLNFGFVELRVMDGNVGYLRLDGCLDGPAAIERADQAMAFLSGVDALIIDVRANGGGGIGVINRISSYLFEDSVHLYTMQSRDGEPVESWTNPKLPGKRLTKIPVYVLTSDMTFSAAEGFLFGLVRNKRITVVGETTGGGGHYGGEVGLGKGLRMFLPRGWVHHPTAKDGWEAEGIAPDKEVNADDAIEVAHQSALKALGQSISLRASSR